VKKYFLHLFFVVLFVSGCRNFQEVQCTGVDGFKINTIGTEGIDGDVMLKLKNPNPMGFSIYKSSFDVTYSGIYLGQAKLTKAVHIKAKAEEVYSFNLRSDFKNITVVEVMKLLGGASYKNLLEVKGDLNAGKFFIKKKYPVNIKEKLNLK